ncbi:MAG: hypothetical protein RL097_373, partial [Candidatus Parcubacteria bacterium]
APRAGFEPATNRLTVDCSTAELPRKVLLVLVKNKYALLYIFFVSFQCLWGEGVWAAKNPGLAGFFAAISYLLQLHYNIISRPTYFCIVLPLIFF